MSRDEMPLDNLTLKALAFLVASASSLVLLIAAPLSKDASASEGIAFPETRIDARRAQPGVRAAQDGEIARVSLKVLRQNAGLRPVEVQTEGGLVEAARTWLGLLEKPNGVEVPSEAPDGVPRCYCNKPEMRDGQVRLVSPRELLSRVGIDGNFAAWVVEAESLEVLDDYEGAPLLLDPRLREVVAIPQRFSGPGGATNLLVIFGRLEEEPLSPQAVPKEVDASRGVTLRFVSGPSASMRLERRIPGRWLTIYAGPSGEIDVQRRYGFEGLELTEFPTPAGEQIDNTFGVGLAIGAQYRITTASGQVIDFTTRPANRRGWTFKGKLARKYRAVFLREVKRLHPIMRRIADQVAGYTTISVRKGYGSSSAGPLQTYDRTPDSWGWINFSEGMIADPKVRRETVAHEIAHIVEYFGIGYGDLIELNKLARKSKRWKRCNGNRRPGDWSLTGAWPCTPEEEMRAEQITFAVTRGYDDKNTGYGTPKLVPGARVRSWLSSSFALTSLYEPGGDLTDPGWRGDFCRYIGCKPD